MIGIVVDHPNRDLPGLAILAEEFIKKNKKVALIPSNKIDHVLLTSIGQFELIIFNFFRIENYKKILYTKNHGIKVAVLDQEPVGGHDGEAQRRIFLHPKLKNHLNKIDFFFFTSKHLKSICINSSKILPKNNIVSGYNRLDIVKKNNNNVKNKDFILISTNFPATNPLFVKNKHKIIKSIHKYSNIKINYEKIKNIIDKKFNLQKNFYFEIERILKNYKNLKFVLRPHPFEEVKFWKPLEYNYKNCKVTNKLNSLEWIKKCILLIHLDCNTSCEASILNKPSISLKYLFKNTEKFLFKIAHECSISCNNFNEVKNILDKILLKQKIKPKISNKLIKFYYNPNQLSSKYIVDTICNDKNKINDTDKKKLNINKSRLDLMSYIKTFIENYFGERAYNFFLYFYRGFKVVHSRKIKYFSKDDIYKYINKKIRIKKYKYFYILWA